jgi:hypothetical protein
MATKASVCAAEYVDKYSQSTSEPRGTLRAYKVVQITDIFGNTRMRKVSLGSDYSVNLENAQRLVNTARAADADPGSIGAHLVIGL